MSSTVSFTGSTTKDDGVLTFQVPGALQKYQTSVKLVDVDFPVGAQHDVERKNCAAHYHEGIHIYPTSRTVSLLLEDTGGARYEMNAIVPLTVNRIVEISNSTSDKTVIVHTEHPHGFFAPAAFGRTTKNVIGTYSSALPSGSVPLTIINSTKGAFAVDPNSMSFHDEKSVKIAYESVKEGIDGFGGKTTEMGWFVTPILPNLTSLSEILTAACNGVVSIQHEKGTAQTKIFSAGSTRPISISGDELSKTIFGYDGVYAGLEVALIPPGNYSLSHPQEGRIPFSKAVEEQMNRFHIKEKESNIIFRDVKGYTWKASLPHGNYATGEKLAKCIEHMMNLTSKSSKKSFSVNFVEEDGMFTGRFVFSANEAFDILFGDEESMNPKTLGFEAVDLIGRTSYSSHGMRRPNHKPNSNVNDCKVLEGSNKLHLSRRSKKSLDGRIVSYDDAHSLLKMKCVERMNGNSVCTGLLDGDVVTLTSALPQPDGATGQERKSFSLRPKRRILGVVVAAPDDDKDANDASTAYISVPNHGWFKGFEEYVNIDPPESPFSIALFDMTMMDGGKFFQDSFGASRLGFASGVTDAVDGLVVGDGSVSFDSGPICISLVEDTMTKTSTDVFDQDAQSRIGVVKRDGTLAVGGSTKLASNASTVSFSFTNTITSAPYVFNGNSVTLVVEFS